MDDFNPRSREGSDPLLYCCSVSVSLFQSTLPRGERRADCNDWCLSFAISIHAPARGATINLDESGPVHGISIHAPARGATVSPSYHLHSSQTFQSTLPRGERRRNDSSCLFTEGFQSTLPRGERPRTTSPIPLMILISIHAPARGATYLLPIGLYTS